MTENAKTGKRRRSRKNIKVYMVLFAFLGVLVSYGVLKTVNRDFSLFGARPAYAESSSNGETKAEDHGGGEKKADEGEKAAEGHGEKKAEGAGGEKKAAEAGKPAGDNVIEADRRKRAAAEARKELEGLEEKRLQIKKQEEKLKAEQEKLKILKQELSDKVSELETMHQKIEESLQKIERKRAEKEVVSKEAQEKRIKQLVKMYSTMKPKQAGAIVNSMDIVIAEKIFMNMKGDAAGKILAYVESSKAALISERLAISVGRTEGRP